MAVLNIENAKNKTSRTFADRKFGGFRPSQTNHSRFDPTNREKVPYNQMRITRLVK